ncbi:Polyketide synthase PksH [Pyrenophora tritici-repentis]|nr:Polyketide synthase PksH [Pyrenophora tritici-repentis]
MQMLAYVFEKSFDDSISETTNMDWEYSVKDRNLYVPRLYPDFEQDRAASGDDQPLQLQAFSCSGKTLVFQPTRSGVSGTGFCFMETTNTVDDLPNGFVEVEAKAFGLNIVGANEENRSIAHEGSGLVRQLGPGTQDSGLRVGDRVCGIFKGPISNNGRAHWTSISKVPDNFTWSEAASIPYAHATAWLALCHIARLQKRERVLLHFATAGVGCCSRIGREHRC